MNRRSMTFTLAGCFVAAGLTACQTSQPQRAAEISRAAAPAPQISEADRQLANAHAFQEQGRLDSALAAFGMALEENPRLTEAHMGMGDIFRERGSHEIAAHAYERAAAIDPKLFEAQYYLGLMRQLLGQTRAAIKAYHAALKIRPSDALANRDLASAYLQVGDPHHALKYAEAAVEADPESQPAWCNLAATYSLLGEYEKAVGAYRQAADTGQLATPVLLGLADAHIKLGHYARAVNVLNSLVRKDPSSTAYERLGYAQFKRRNIEFALTAYTAAVEMDSTDTAALNGLGATRMTLYLKGGRHRSKNHYRDGALTAWRQSVKIKPDQPLIVDLLARYGKNALSGEGVNPDL